MSDICIYFSANYMIHSKLNNSEASSRMTGVRIHQNNVTEKLVQKSISLANLGHAHAHAPSIDIDNIQLRHHNGNPTYRAWLLADTVLFRKSMCIGNSTDVQYTLLVFDVHNKTLSDHEPVKSQKKTRGINMVCHGPLMNDAPADFFPGIMFFSLWWYWMLTPILPSG